MFENVTSGQIARRIAMTGAGAVVGTMIGNEKNDNGYSFSGNASDTFIGMGVGAAVGGIGLPLAGKLAKSGLEKIF